MAENAQILQEFRWSALDKADAYQNWRSAKLKVAETALDQGPVELESLEDPGESAGAEILLRCRNNNFAQYRVASPPRDERQAQLALRKFAAAFGLRIAEAHRSAEETGIVALRVSSDPSRRGYIPYTTKPLNWHTDGYYNAPGERISAFVLHCQEQALKGGENQLLDPEIAYLRLRDENPDYVRAMMHPQAMTIPANTEPNGKVRPESVGPVFYPDPDTGRLQMRYTARTRSIAWRDDPATQEAADFLRQLLTGGDPLALNVRLSAGEGILNNNILHNRTGFDDDQEAGRGRVVYRVRFSNRVKGS